MEKILLVGSGLMATEYAKVLESLNISFFVVGRSEVKSLDFQKHFPKVEVKHGGLHKYIKEGNILPTHSIVAVNVEQLAETTSLLIRNGVSNILVEKPAGLDYKEIAQVNTCANQFGTKVFVAYNRRFYASTLATIDFIQKDGGVSSFSFEFTEWGHQIQDLPKPDKVKQNWFLGNSTHVVDLAFFLGGSPQKISSYQSGSLSWHPAASQFSGSGCTISGSLFSYNANWAAPGRWGVEILTNNNRLILRPMERLQIIKKGNINIEEVNLDYSLDIKFKPGLYLQTKAFLLEGDKNPNLLLLNKHVEIVEKIYSKICKY